MEAAVDNPATRGGRSVAILGDDGVRYYAAHFDTIGADVVVDGRLRCGKRPPERRRQLTAPTGPSPSRVDVSVESPASPVHTMVHLLGFVGSALIVTGVMMRRVAWLRTFALAGSLIFIAYGTLLGAWPVVLTNVTTTSLHLYHLRSHLQTRRRLDGSASSTATASGSVRLKIWATGSF